MIHPCFSISYKFSSLKVSAWEWLFSLSNSPVLPVLICPRNRFKPLCDASFQTAPILCRLAVPSGVPSGTNTLLLPKQLCEGSWVTERWEVFCRCFYRCRRPSIWADLDSGQCPGERHWVQSLPAAGAGLSRAQGGGISQLPFQWRSACRPWALGQLALPEAWASHQL